jgi:hypothetical protein
MAGARVFVPLALVGVDEAGAARRRPTVVFGGDDGTLRALCCGCGVPVCVGFAGPGGISTAACPLRSCNGVVRRNT